MTDPATVPASPLPPHWRGLGAWNYYFLTKFMLLWWGQLNFHPLYNLAFAAFLLIPLPSLWLHRLRHGLAVPLGVALYYFDSWLPPFKHLLAQTDNLSQFSLDYLLELAARFINLTWLAGGLVLWLVYLFLHHWLRLTTFTVIALGALFLVDTPGLWSRSGIPSPLAGSSISSEKRSISQEKPIDDAINTEVIDPQLAPTDAPLNDAQLNTALSRFYSQQAGLASSFPVTLDPQAQPFDVLILNICSLAWDDMEDTGLPNHSLWKSMDVLFEDFNSAATYSGPAVLRLLRASCGQSSNEALYRPAEQRCYLLENLKNLGFEEALVMNHNGRFGNLLEQLKTHGRVGAALRPFGSLLPVMTGFDGSPIYRDSQVLSQWWDERLKNASLREVLFYNSISLHDGNRRIDPVSGKTVSAAYRPRLQNLFDDIHQFIKRLETSGRPVLLVLVPEHGAALRGDLMQVEGLREIPSPTITHVPAGLKFINVKAKLRKVPVRVAMPSSYFALSELMARLVNGEAWQDADYDIEGVVNNLPALDKLVGENEGSVMMRVQGKHYLRLDGESWSEYPLH